VTNLRVLGPLADGRAESPGESALRLAWWDAGLPEPTPQLEFWEDGVLIARADLGNEDLGYVAEYDGVEWHTTEAQRLHDRERRDAMADHGYVVDAFTRVNVYGQRRNAEQLLVLGARRARAERERRRLWLP
jgi:hypothetical protein